MIQGINKNWREDLKRWKKLYPRRFVDYDGNIAHNVPDGKWNIKKDKKNETR
jgi:hypothetical protein